MSGGTCRIVRPWNVDDGTLEPLGFKHGLPNGK
jgi:hypothetical protein